MYNIPDIFSGYINVDENLFSYYISNFIVTMLPAYDDRKKRREAFDLVTMNKNDVQKFIYGDYNGRGIAIQFNYATLYSNLLGTDKTIRFSTPIVIMSENACDPADTWNNFHAITFHGGNINPIFHPRIALESKSTQGYTEDGSQNIKLRPWDDYSLYKDFILNGEKAKLTLSVSHQCGEHSELHTDGYRLGTLNSFLRLSFENEKHFENISEYYKIIKDLISLLTGQSNVCTEVYLSQKNEQEQFLKTASCNIYHSYENLSKRQFGRVVPISEIWDYIPNILDCIANHDSDALLCLLPDDNRKLNTMSITNVQDMCTALEMSYEWEKIGTTKDALIKELKNSIKKTINDYAEKHNELDINKETNIASCFKYLDLTLIQKILTLYEKNHNVIDYISPKWNWPKINEENVKNFVSLRNKKTHAGKIEWRNSAELYRPLLALVYTCFFKHAKLPAGTVLKMLLQIF